MNSSNISKIFRLSALQFAINISICRKSSNERPGQTSSVLDEEIKKRKTKYKTFEIHHQNKHAYRKFPFKE